MRLRGLVLVAILGAVSADISGSLGRISASQVIPSASPARSPRFVEGELLVRFKHNSPKSRRTAAHSRIGAKTTRAFKILDDLELVRLPSSLSVREALAQYRHHPDVLYAEPNHIVNAAVLPNDPRFGELWGLDKINAPDAWNATTGSPAVVVAVLDTGIDYRHEDLKENMFRNMPDCNANGIDDEGNGYVDDCYGIDVMNHDSNPMDDHGHGTHIAGMIGATGNNGLGVVGVNWHVRLMPCKFMNQEGRGTTAGAIACLEYVKTMKDSGVNIVATNNSWAFREYSQALSDTIDEQREHGILFATSAGNGDGSDNDKLSLYPASYALPNILTVAATTPSDDLAVFSNVGHRTVHLGAPGEDILSTVPLGGYAMRDGTSMAAPHVTGVAALLKAQNPARDWRAIKNLILAGGDSVPALAQNTVTGKRLNAFGALACWDSTVMAPVQPVGETGSVGVPLTLAALHINCDVPNGNVPVTIDPGGETLTLLDDGIGADRAADDGIYTAQWIPSMAGTYTLRFQNVNVTVTILSQYQSVVAPYNYRPITGTNLNLGDDASAAIDSPFDIMFGDQAFKTLFVSSNGNITFSTPFRTDTFNEPLPTRRLDTLVAPFWDDLVAWPETNQNVFWEVRGDAPNRELIVEWRGLAHRQCAAGSITFEVVFFERSSDVFFNYAGTTLDGRCAFAEHGRSATAGIQTSRDSALSFSVDAPNIRDGTALLWTTTSSPQTATVSFSLPSSSVFERDRTAPIEVTLTTSDGMPTLGGGSVDHAITGGTAAGDRDYVTRTGTGSLKWSPGTPSGQRWSINVRIIDDPLEEGDEYFVVALNAPAGAELGLSTHTVTIRDDDVLPGAPPAIVAQPKSRTILPGQRTTMTVEAAGTSPLRYQWYQEQLGATPIPIPGATARSYTTPTLTATTMYWVRVSNQYGPDATSAAATITLGTFSNGKIAFTSRRDGNSEIHVMNPDGSDLSNLSNNLAEDFRPAWSPDGTRIAFTTTRSGSTRIFVMNADGTQPVSCTRDTVTATWPAWSPDGTRIVFSQFRRTLVDPPDGIYLVNVADCSASPPSATPLVVLGGPDLIGQPAWSPDGNSIVYVRTTYCCEERLFVRSIADELSQPGVPLLNISPLQASSPKWSADGRTIVFTGYVPGNLPQIYVIAADGTSSATPLTTVANYDGAEPALSPEGNRIAFATIRDGNSEIYVMNADGTEQTNVSRNAADDRDPDWQRLTSAAIAMQPASQAIVTGQQATLRVVASGTEPLAYQWYEGISGDVSNPIHGATGSSYTTPPLTHDTQYWVRVSNAFGSVSGDFAFDTVRLFVSGSASQPSATFFFDDFSLNDSMPDDFEGPTISPLWTATQQNGTISLSTDQAHSGSKSVRFTSSSGGQPSILLTQTLPQLTKGTVSTWFYDSAAGGGTLNAGLTVFDSSDPTRAFGVSVADWDSSRWVWSAPGVNDTASSYLRTPGWHQLKLHMAATGFKAFVDNTPISNGSVNSETATITVGVPPTITPITRQPPTPILPAGQAATLCVLATGTQPLSYQWYAGSSGDTTSPIEGADAGCYTTSPLFRDAAYWVRVWNAFGAAHSTITIPVLGAPVITAQPANAMIAPGSAATLTVTARGAEPLTYQWYEGVSHDITSPIQGATESQYTATATNSAPYWVRVSNLYGFEDSATAVVSVPTIIASGPKGGSGECTTDGTMPITVIWQGIDPSATDYFALYILDAPDTHSLRSWPTGGTTGDSYIVTLPEGLSPGPYVFRLFGRNGKLAESNTFFVTPPAPMVTVNPATAEAGGALTVNWRGISTPTAHDSFGLIAAGASEYAARQNTGGASSGTALMPLPQSLAPGHYEVRLLAGEPDHLLATSEVIRVTRSQSGPVVIASPPTIVLGGSLAVSWKTVITPTMADWFAIVRADAPDTDYVAGSAHYTGGAADGSLLVMLPLTMTPGLYEVRLFAGDRTRLVKSNAFFADLNRAPSFVKGPDQTVRRDSSAKTITDWATNISAGSAHESSQTLAFIVTNSNNALFSSQPEVSPNGTLTFTLMANVSGSAIVNVQLRDDGGVVNGGADTSDTQTFVINVLDINRPTLTLPVQTGGAGSAEMEMSIGYSSNEAGIAGLNFDLHYDRTVLSIVATAGPATISANKILVTSLLPNGNTRYLIFGLNQTILSDGSVVDLKIRISPDASAGSYPLQFFNVAATDPDGRSVALESQDGKVIVADTNGPAISLMSPANDASYARNQVVTASYTCSDASGVGGCAGPVPSGSPIDTSTPGTFTFAVNASDIPGNITTKAVWYHVLVAGAPATVTLSPAASAGPVGTSHTVTATVEDAFGNATPGIIVYLSVSGTVTTTGQCTTNPSGQCAFGYTGPTALGGDTISAYADTNTNAVQDPGEPAGAASKTWVAGVPATVTLSPATAANPVGTNHTVTATVRDAFGNATPEIIVRFSVSGAVTTTGPCTTNPSGQCAFTYTGPSAPGTDAITAYADTNSDAVQNTSEPTGAAAKTWTAVARIVFASTRDGNSEIYVMSADGTGLTRLTNNPAVDKMPAWSPDHTKIAFATNRHGSSNFEIYIMNADGTGQMRLTNNAAIDKAPTWSPDGTKIAFATNRHGNFEIYTMNAVNGTGLMRLTVNPAIDSEPTWSPDGARIAFSTNRHGSTNFEIYTMNATNGMERVRLTTNPAIDAQPSWSPDGSRIAFTTNRHGTSNSEIYTMTALNGTSLVRLTMNPAVDAEPAWSPDGAKIAFTTNRDGTSKFEIYLMNANGSSQTRLTTHPNLDISPAW